MSNEQESSPVGNLAAVAPEGAQVLQEVVQMTGLPKEFVDSEISSLLGTSEEGVNNLTLDQLRLVMLNYLETINEEMTQQQSQNQQFS